MYVCSELKTVLPVSMMMPLPLALLVQIKVHPKYLSTAGKLPPLLEMHCQPRHDRNVPQNVFLGRALWAFLGQCPPSWVCRCPKNHQHRWRLECMSYVANKAIAVMLMCNTVLCAMITYAKQIITKLPETLLYTKEREKVTLPNRQNGTMVFTFIHNEGKLNLNHMIINYNTMIYLFMI